MYCPKCAAQNLDDAKFCRTCGADISLVPQAVTGELAERLAAVERGGAAGCSPGKESPSVEGAVVSLFMGAAFLVIALALSMSASGDNWWFYMLIPSFVFFGKGVGALVHIREDRLRPAPPAYASETTHLQPPRHAGALTPRDTGEMIARPPSVTEATTRHLGVAVERKPKDV
jgi:hypothetical protein